MLSEHSQHEQSGEGATGSGDKKDGEQEDQEATEPGKKEGAVDEKPLTSEEVLDPTLSPGSHQEIDAFWDDALLLDMTRETVSPAMTRTNREV